MRRVVFVAIPPIQILDLTGPFEVFARCGGYDLELVSTGQTDQTDQTGRTGEAGQAGQVLDSSCGLMLCGARDYRSLRRPVDTLVVPGGAGAEALAYPRELLDWLRGVSVQARRTCGICTGAFLLAAAGLLDGRRATTHWRWCDRLARQFPAVAVERDPIFVKDGSIYTSAGVTSGIDLALELVREDFGVERARTIARELVVFLRRAGGQSQFSSILRAQLASREPVRDLHAWILDHLTERLDVDALAGHCGMSPRHFARVFTAQAGITPARFVEQVRVGAAQVLLETSALGLDAIAAHSGFGSPDSMRRSFVRLLAVTPQQYGARVRGVR